MSVTVAWSRIGRQALLLSLLIMASAQCLAMTPTDTAELLERADSIKTSSHAEFTSILASLERRVQELSPTQQEYLRYLQGWQHAYVGNYEDALKQLRSFVDSSDDATLQFRARATMVNVLSIARRYEEAFTELSKLLDRLGDVTDKGAREQGLTVAALLYNEVGQNDLSLIYSDMVIEENWNGRGVCRGGQLKVRALFENSRERARPAALREQIDQGIAACTAAGELTYANVIRGYAARLHMEDGEIKEALDLLQQHYGEVAKSQYPRLISQFDVLLAQVYWQMGETSLARQFATRAVDGAVKNEFTEPLVTAYSLLYAINRKVGDAKAALDYHEKYAAADKGYIDDIGARQLAYERVRHEVAANKLQIESLQLQRKLDAKAIENVRLYIALLIVTLGFIAFWAYKTKRSQLHFMNLSRRDGLTGIFNRPHFMELATSTLENTRKSKQQVALVVCDLDHFKDINDKFGHSEGDEALKRMVAACLPHLRAADIFARVGGEEFCILLPGCNVDHARERADRLRCAIAAIEARGAAAMTASMGVSSTEVSGYTLAQLIAHADIALYRAKHEGRNRVSVFEATNEAVPDAPTNRSSAGFEVDGGSVLAPR